MPAYSDAQVTLAHESWTFWRSKFAAPVHVAALLGNEDGETSFVPKAVGDRGEAFGPFQWHEARIDAMKLGCGIDVKTASHADQLQAAFWEMSDPKSPYRKVWPALMATTDLEGAVTVLVHSYEQSGSQARDILRRTNLASYWLKFATDNQWDAGLATS